MLGQREEEGRCRAADGEAEATSRKRGRARRLGGTAPASVSVATVAISWAPRSSSVTDTFPWKSMLISVCEGGPGAG